MNNKQSECPFEEYTPEWFEHPANKRAKWLMIVFVWALIIGGGLLFSSPGGKCDDRTGDDCYEQSYDYDR